MASKRHYIDPYDYLNDEEDNDVIKILDALEHERQEKQQEEDKNQISSERETKKEEGTKDFDKNKEEDLTRAEINDYLDKINSDNEETRTQARERLKRRLPAWGLSYVDNIKYYPLSREEKHIIRMDYYGTIDEPVKNPKRSKSTPAYLSFINSPYKEKLDNPQYDLDSSAAWNKFRQFPRFRKIEFQLIAQLQAENIPPSLIAQMNAYDYADILYRAFKDTADEYGKVRIFNGARINFVKDFIKKNEEKFRLYLKHIKIDERYAETLIEMMKERGITNNIDCFDTQKARELLHNYQKEGLLPAEEKISNKISSKQLEFIKYRGDYGKIVYRDSEGKELSGPTFTVHHKIAVKDGGEATYLADVNHFENLCLMVDNPYHRLMHSLDRTEISNFREAYKARIYIKDSQIIFWGGMSPEYQIKYDYSQDRQAQEVMSNNYQWIAEHLSNIKPLPDIDPEMQNAVLYRNKHSRKQKKREQKEEQKQALPTTGIKEKKKRPPKKKKEETLPSPSSIPAKEKPMARKVRIFKEIKKAYIEQKQEKHKLDPKSNLRKVKKIRQLIAALYQTKIREEAEKQKAKDKLPSIIYQKHQEDSRQ